ncbi:hypothetical protein [Dyella subtropica]|uniref:hypothetical protein n=1 Tax=Dyella subtropica TaxID=2992127 RepID=UPI002253AEE7|nr:hypothetical protein [Dyella subtropica]
MPLHFEAANGSAIDHQHGLEVFQPRMEPTENQGEVEYQYWIFRGESQYSLGCFGTFNSIKNEGRNVDVFTLNLGQNWVIESIFKTKDRLNILGDKFSFLVGLSEGLVRVFQSRRDNDNEVRYLALSQEAVLHDHGIAIPDGLLRLPNGDIVLAEVTVPAHPSASTVS